MAYADKQQLILDQISEELGPDRYYRFYLGLEIFENDARKLNTDALFDILKFKAGADEKRARDFFIENISDIPESRHKYLYEYVVPKIAKGAGKLGGLCLAFGIATAIAPEIIQPTAMPAILSGLGLMIPSVLYFGGCIDNGIQHSGENEHHPIIYFLEGLVNRYGDEIFDLANEGAPFKDVTPYPKALPA